MPNDRQERQKTIRLTIVESRAQGEARWAEDPAAPHEQQGVDCWPGNDACAVHPTPFRLNSLNRCPTPWAAYLHPCGSPTPAQVLASTGPAAARASPALELNSLVLSSRCRREAPPSSPSKASPQGPRLGRHRCRLTRRSGWSRAWRWPRRGPCGGRRAGRPSGASRSGARDCSRGRHRCGWRAGSEGCHVRSPGRRGVATVSKLVVAAHPAQVRLLPARVEAAQSHRGARPLRDTRILARPRPGRCLAREGAPADAVERTAREPGAGKDRGRTLQGGLSSCPFRSGASPARPGLRPRPLPDPRRRAGAGAGPPGAQRTLSSARRWLGARPAVRAGLHMRPPDARATIARWPGALRDPRASDRCRPATRPALGYPVSVAA